MSQRPLEVDRLAIGIFNRAAVIVGGLGDEKEALQLCRDLGLIEQSYCLVLRTELFGRPRTSAPSSDGRLVAAASTGAKFVGKPISSKFDTACKVCRAPIRMGTEVLWRQGAGVACITCGEVG